MATTTLTLISYKINECGPQTRELRGTKAAFLKGCLSVSRFSLAGGETS